MKSKRRKTVVIINTMILITMIQCFNVHNQNKSYENLTLSKPMEVAVKELKEYKKIVKENASKEQKNVEKKNKSEVQNSNKSNIKTFELTFYTALDDENGFGPITAIGTPLADKMLLASNTYPPGTIINLDKIGTLRVEDTGGKDLHPSHRLDVYIPRKKGESDTAYKKRIKRYGRVNVKGVVMSKEKIKKQ